LSELAIKLKNKLINLTYKIYTYLIKNNFNKFGKNSIIKFGIRLNHPNRINVGNNVIIEKNVWFNADDRFTQKNECTLNIYDGVNIGRYTQINAFKSVIIEENVLIAENVYIGDTDHKNSIKEIPISKQGVEYKGPVLIKKGAFICRNAIISGGITIGENAIVGPNSFIIKSVPKNKMAIGNPAKIFNRKEENL